MRVILNATITFGMVAIPVGLGTAAKRDEQSFRLIHKARAKEDECNSPIKLKQWCPVHDRELLEDEVGRGYEYAKGMILAIDDEEMAEMTAETSKFIAIEKFVPTGDVIPYIEKDYYLKPQKALMSQYMLLYNAMAKSGTCGVGKSVLWGVEKPCAVHATPNGIQLSMLYCAEEVKSAAEIQEMMAVAETRKVDQDFADELVETLSDRLVPEEDLVSPSALRTQAYLEAKLANLEVQPIVARDVPDPSPDITDTLRLSVAKAKKERAVTKRKPARKAVRA